MATFTEAQLDLQITTPFGPDKLLVRRVEGEEHISDLFDFRLELVSQDSALDFSTIVGKDATLKLTLADGSDRILNGIVARFAQAGSSARFTTYFADLRPWLWLCTLTSDCRIFQNKSVPDIIETVFKDLGFNDFRNSLSGTYQPREYCVQYRESAFQFVSRLMEEEGIFYFFEHQEGKHILVMGDDPSVHNPCPGLGTVEYRPADRDMDVQSEGLFECRLEQQVVTGKAAGDDFNFETPATDLMSEVAGQDGKLRRYDYPTGQKDSGGGERIARLRLESFELPQKSLQGQGVCRAFTPGYKFTLKEHPRDDLNAGWVLRSIVHRAVQEGPASRGEAISRESVRYSNSFTAFPDGTPFRPPLVTPLPRIAGTQTATVVGKKGEEIWTDKYGRIKVQFHWDQLGKNDENSSCWIRVAQNWAGKSWGAFFLPRIGQEVVVSFLEGDPDRPLVTGGVYNAQQTVPYPLPGEQTKSTVKSNSSKGGGGDNEIRFEDKKGSEEIYVHAQKDMNIKVENDRSKEVLNNETITVKQNRTATIQEGNESLTVAKGNRTLQVSKGNEDHKVEGTRTLNVTKDETHNAKANFNRNVDQDYTLKVKGNLTIDVTGNVVIKSAQDMTLQAGKNLTGKAGMNLTQQAGANAEVKAGANLTAQGTAQAKLQGAMAEVSASGITQVKGSLVKLN